MPAGRPRKLIPIEQLKDLAKRQWSTAQIAAHFGIAVQTLTDNYYDIICNARLQGRALITKMIWDKAEGNGPDAMRALERLDDRFNGPIAKKIELSKEAHLEWLEQENQRLMTESGSNLISETNSSLPKLLNSK